VRCYNHPERDAVGSCKSCCKGLCTECAVDLGHGLSCRGEHEQREFKIPRRFQDMSRQHSMASWALYFVATVSYPRTPAISLFYLAPGSWCLRRMFSSPIERRMARRNPVPNKSLERTREG